MMTDLKPWVERTPYRFSPHARCDRLAQHGLSQKDVADALGADLVSGGRLSCRRSDQPGATTAEARPSIGNPVLIGTSFAFTARRHVLIAVNPLGRRIHTVVAIEANAVEVITVWCPDDPYNVPLWHPHALRPTRAGDNALPPTHWYLDDRNTPVAA